MIRNSSYKSLLELDANLCLKVNSLSGRKFLDTISYYISRLGDGTIYFAVLFFYIYLFKKPFLLTFRDYLLASAINLLLYKIIKKKVKRVRPFSAMDSITKIIVPPDEFSFPSGHAGAAAVFCCCTFYHMPIIPAVLSVVWMILVGFSRVYNGVHYPGDVMAGYLMGSVVSKAVLFYFH